MHNWIDPCGLGEGILTLRMAEFPGGRPNDDLAAKSRVVPLASLRAELPAETKWVTAAERAQQLAARAAAYARRLPRSPDERSPIMSANPGAAADGWLITGCSTGIGRHIAEAALAKGHRVAVTARKRDARRGPRGRASRPGDRARARRDRARAGRRRGRARPSAPSAASTCS